MMMIKWLLLLLLLITLDILFFPIFCIFFCSLRLRSPSLQDKKVIYKLIVIHILQVASLGRFALNRLENAQQRLKGTKFPE